MLQFHRLHSSAMCRIKILAARLIEAEMSSSGASQDDSLQLVVFVVVFPHLDGSISCILKRTSYGFPCTHLAPLLGEYVLSEYIFFLMGWNWRHQLDSLRMFHLESWSWFWFSMISLSSSSSSFTIHHSQLIGSLNLQLLKPLRFSQPLIIICLHIKQDRMLHTPENQHESWTRSCY